MKEHSLRHKLRYIVKNNKTGDVIGITMPRDLLLGNKKLESFIGVTFHITISGNAIILESGCDSPTALKMKDINKLILEEKKIVI